MADKYYALEIYDADGYRGPNPVRVAGRGMVHGPENSHYFIVEPDTAVEINGAPVSQLAVRPHYEGDPADRVTDSICTVGIALAPAGVTYQPNERYGFSEFCFWKVGKIHPSNGH